MTRRLLQFFVFFHICVGGAFALFHGPFYGDAQNFYGYAEEIGSLRDFLEWTDYTSIQNINVFFVSIIYGSAFQSAVINTLALLFFSSLLHPKKILRDKKYTTSDISKFQLYVIASFVILCPSVIVRLAEPSREYLQAIFLFVVGFCFSSKGSHSLLWLALCLVILIRPVAAPIYLLWLGFFWVQSKRNLTKIIFLCLFLALIVASKELQIVQLYYEKSIDYDGVLGDSQALLDKMVLNVFGDVNSFVSNRYPMLDRIIFFLDYVWRLLFLASLLFRGGKAAFVFIVFASLIVSTFYPFPHPRYFVPALFFLGGIVYGRHMTGWFADIKAVPVASVRRSYSTMDGAKG